MCPGCDPVRFASRTGPPPLRCFLVPPDALHLSPTNQHGPLSSVSVSTCGVQGCLLLTFVGLQFRGMPFSCTQLGKRTDTKPTTISALNPRVSIRRSAFGRPLVPFSSTSSTHTNGRDGYSTVAVALKLLRYSPEQHP